MIPLRDDNPRRHFPAVTVALILANAAGFLWELGLGERLEAVLLASAFVPAKIFAPGAGGGDLQLLPAVLSMFLHGGLLHLGGNLLFLWVFGDNVEDRLGAWRFLAFYLLCGLAATYAHAFTNPASAAPVIGASGAISGVLGAYLFLFPTTRIKSLLWLGIFVQVVEVPAIVYLLLWFALQFVSGLLSLSGAAASTGGVAWFAHVGGFVAGPLLLLVFGGRARRSRSRR